MIHEALGTLDNVLYNYNPRPMKSVARRSGRLHVGVTCEGRERVEQRAYGEDGRLWDGVDAAASEATRDC